ncbi:MAG: BPSS1780 family membrane protein [Rubrivivax sp.]|nr:BPSS1780 family membrane protein [Rubrivivax sp.]
MTLPSPRLALQLKAVPPGRGARWVIDAFRIFGRRPLAFTTLFMLFLFVALVSSLVPLIGGVAQMMALPLLSLGFMIATQSALLDGPVHPGQFIEPLRTDPKRRRALLVLCAVYGVAAVVILLLCDVVSDGALARLQTMMARGDTPQADFDALFAEPGLSAAVIVGVLLGTLLAVPFWHAPALVHWGSQSVGQALFSSTLALWRSKGAFLVYALTWFAIIVAFGVVSALLFGLLGMRQLAPVLALPAGLMFSTVFYISLLFTFSDSFGGRTPTPAEPAPERDAV